MTPGSFRPRYARLRRWIVPAAAVGAVWWTMANHALERMLIYFPYRQIEALPSQLGLDYSDVWMRTTDGLRIHGWFVPASGAKRTLLLFHGNAGNISHRLGWIEALHGLRVNVFIIDYRGYGRSEGAPFEDGLYLDALAAWRWWSESQGAGGDLVLLGESLGGAVAVHLAARSPCSGIILQSTFSSGRDMARRLFPFGLLQPLAGVRFDSLTEIRAVRCPKLVIHGDRDSIVPFELGRKLFDAAQEPKYFFQVRGADHNDLVDVGGREYLGQIERFLAGIPSGQPPENAER